MNSEAKSIEGVAADWLARHEAGLSASEETRFAAWLEADARHARSFHALRQSWSRLDRLCGTAVAARMETELDELLARSTDQESETGDQGRGTKDRGIQPTRMRVLPWISGALAASVVWLVTYFAWWRPAQSHAPYAETAATAVGVMRTIALPDGSTLQLNTDTAVEVVFTRAERRVRLGRGEARFKVAKNPIRPFVVSAAGVDVRAVGTEFNVRLRSESLEVTVCEGRVRVDHGASGESLLAASATPAVPGDSAPVLAAGQRVVIPVRAAPQITVHAGAPARLAAVEIERSLAWQNGRLVFEDAPLSVIVAEFNRYTRQPLVIPDPAFAARRFGGTFVANDPGTFIELLRATCDLAIEERAGERVLRLRQ